LPVIARPDTRGYRTAKFIQRHKAAVVAIALVFVSLTGGIATALWQAHIAKQQRDRARLEQAKADRIKSFMTDMLTYSSPEYTSSNPTKNQDAKVSEVVDQAAKRAEAELADQPEVLADAQSTIGGVYVAQGRYAQAEAILRAAREKSIRIYGTNSHQNAEVSGTLANALLGKGNYAEADALFRQDIEIERRLAEKGRGNDKDLARVLAAYGGMLDQRQDRAAEGYLREALKYSSAFTGKERVFVAMLYNDLSNEATYRGDADEGERCLRASLEEYRKLPAGTYVEMAVTLSNLGAVLIAKGKYTEAEPFVLEGLELRRRVLGDAHTGTGGALFRLSDLRYRQGRYGEAEKAAQESIEVFKRALASPQDSTLFTNPLFEMGLILDKVGRIHEAEAYLRQAFDIRTRLLPKGNLGIVKAEGPLGECLTMQKRYAEAEPLLLDSYQILESTTGPNDGRRTEAAQRLNELYSRWGNPKKAALYEANHVSAINK
jgi:tetratricopeptide (TPR) repeat protein